MKRISSGLTGFRKRGLPVLWFGIVGGTTALVLVRGRITRDYDLLAAPVAMLGFGYALMKTLVWDLMDEVYDDGDRLVVRNRGREYQIPLSSIVEVSYSVVLNPQRITLTLAGDLGGGIRGRQIVFTPVTPFFRWPFYRNPIADDLRARAERARLPASAR